MPDDPPPPPATELSVVIASYLEAVDAGRAPAPQSLIDNHPHLAAELRKFLAAERHLAEAARPLRVADGHATSDTIAAVGERPPARGGVPEAGAAFGAYDLLELVGEGGMGVVYRARHRGLKRVVALKLILAGRHAKPSDRERFRVEAQAAARLSHPGIVQLFEVGEHDGLPFLAEEFCEGGSLAAKLGGNPAPPAEAARIAADLAAAVQAAHDGQIVHRDLKPANVLLTADGRLKVGDFGLAKLLDEAEPLTRTNAILGSPSYMAPEQAAGNGLLVGRSSDVYSLGAILYELLTGRPPFRGTTTTETLQQVIQRDPVPPRRLNRAVPRDLETICLRCLEKDPARRFAAARDLADELGRFLRGEPILSRPVGPTGRLWRWCRRNPRVAALVGTSALLLAVIAVGGVVLSLRLSSALDQAKDDRDAARQAERQAKEKLLQSLVSEAKASRFSRRVGQRFDTLEAIRQAAELARELDRPPETFAELRNLAIAALALPDLRPAGLWTTEPDEPAWATTYYCDFDPGFRLTALTSPEGAISIRRVGPTAADAGEVARLPGFGGEARVRWAPDGRHLAVRHFLINRLQVWRADGPAPVLVLDEAGPCRDAGFTRDGRQIVSVGLGQARVYDAATGRKLRSVTIENPDQNCMDLHPQQPWAALCVRNGVRIVDLMTGKLVRHFTLPQTPVYVAWHPHGELLATSTEHQVHVFDALRGVQLHRLDHPGGGIHVAFNPTGNVLATSGWYGGLRLWNPYTGRPVLTTERTSAYPRFGPDGSIARVFSTDGKRSTGSLARFEPAAAYRTLAAGPGRSGGRDYMGCSLHSNGRLLAVATWQGLSLMDLATGNERAFLPVQTTAVLFEPSGSLLTTTATGLHRWPIVVDPVSPHRLRIGPGKPIPVRLRTVGATLAQGAEGRVLAAGSIDGGVVWPRDAPGEAVRLTPHTECRAVAVSPDGTLVATGSQSGNEIKVWDVRTGRLLRELPTGKYWTIPYFSPDGRRLFNRDGQCWNVVDWSPAPRHPGQHGVAFAPTASLAAWGGHKGYIPLVDPETGRELARLEDPNQDEVIGLTFNADGTQLLGVSNDSACVHVWNLRLIRAGLQELGLDWDAPPYPPAAPEPISREPLHVELVGDEALIKSAGTPGK